MSLTQGNQIIRLSSLEINGILDCVEKTLGLYQVDWIEISLFGSRVDLKKRGGDIDLYLRIGAKAGTDRFELNKTLLAALKERLGDQKIDLVLDDAQEDLGAFGRVIKEQKVVLWTKS